MTLLKSNFALGTYPMPVAQGAEIVVVRMQYDLAAALAVNDVIEMGSLPAGHVPVDFFLDSDETDAGADAILYDAGILTAAKTDIDVTASSGGANWLTGSNIGQAGDLIARPTTNAFAKTQVDDVNDRPLGIHIATGPGTGAASGEVGFTLMYRAAQYGL